MTFNLKEHILTLLKEKQDNFLSHVREEYQELIKQAEHNNIRFDETNLPERMNSYENNLFMPLWSDEYLIERTKYYLSNANFEFNETNRFSLDENYNEALKHKIIHLLLKRLEMRLLDDK